MSEYQGTFKRYEKKYLVTQQQYNALAKVFAARMVPDRFAESTISNIYYDTPDFRLIRRSLDRPAYKEKLRLRTYRTPGADTEAFVEIKKKYDHIVYKRRVAMTYSEAQAYLDGGAAPEQSQISREIDWFLLADEGHQHLQTFFSDLLKMYRKYPALYANDCGYEGFQWINANDGDRSIYSFVRWSPTGKNNLLFVCNFTPVERPDYMCGVPRKKQYRLILDSSDMKYGGPTEKRQVAYRAKEGECDGQPYRIAYSLPAYGVAVFSF